MLGAKQLALAGLIPIIIQKLVVDDKVVIFITTCVHILRANISMHYIRDEYHQQTSLGAAAKLSGAAMAIVMVMNAEEVVEDVTNLLRMLNNKLESSVE